MTASPNLPRGMRLNNPGNLRQSHLPDYRTKIVDGFASFPDIAMGVEALARLTFAYYANLGFHTLAEFVERYAPASENDVQRYIMMVCAYTKRNPLTVRTADLDLDHAWNALHLMRAIVHIEQGAPSVNWPHYPEWISPTQWVLGMGLAGKWQHL